MVYCRWYTILRTCCLELRGSPGVFRGFSGSSRWFLSLFSQLIFSILATLPLHDGTVPSSCSPLFSVLTLNILAIVFQSFFSFIVQGSVGILRHAAILAQLSCHLASFCFVNYRTVCATRGQHVQTQYAHCHTELCAQTKQPIMLASSPRNATTHEFSWEILSEAAARPLDLAYHFIRTTSSRG